MVRVGAKAQNADDLTGPASHGLQGIWIRGTICFYRSVFIIHATFHFGDANMLILDTLSRIVHVGTAITLVGGSVFMLLVLIPSANEKLDDETHKTLGAALISRWKRFVHLGVLLFLVSGFYNYVRAIPSHKGDGLYHALIGTKMLLALGVFFLAAALVGRSEKLEHFRANRSKWLKVLVFLAATIVTISGFAKVRGVPSGSPAVVATESAISD